MTGPHLASGDSKVDLLREPNPGFHREVHTLPERSEQSLQSGVDQHNANLSTSLIQVLSQLDNRRYPKPEEFDINSGQSFTKFLTSFENYCSNTFRGNSDGWTTELRQFLRGPVRQTYDLVHYPGESYVEIRQKLVEWCDEAQGSVIKSNRRKFDQIQMRPGESLRMYAARIEREFRLAFPKKRPLSSETLRSKFLETVPLPVRRHIASAQSIMSITNQSMNWKILLKLVSTYDLHSDDIVEDTAVTPHVTEVWATTEAFPEPDVRDRPLSTQPRSRSLSRPRANLHSDENRRFSTERMGQVNRLQQHRTTSRAYESQSCFYCKRRGHQKKDCWRLNRLCLACGSPDHRISQCPNRRPVMRERSRQPPNFSAEVDSDDVRQGNFKAPAEMGTYRRS